jgi:hypothetical protein
MGMPDTRSAAFTRQRKFSGEMAAETRRLRRRFKPLFSQNAKPSRPTRVSYPLPITLIDSAVTALDDNNEVSEVKFKRVVIDNPYCP